MGTNQSNYPLLGCTSVGGQCPCLNGYTGRNCSQCSHGYYMNELSLCLPCDCNLYGSTSVLCSSSMGQCSCHNNYEGLKCDQCPDGHFDFPYCRSCNCNGFSNNCNKKTGYCNSCQNNTSGNFCNECKHGYYGDPINGIECKPCLCYGETTDPKYSDECVYFETSNNVGDFKCTKCLDGYSGNRCEICVVGYYKPSNNINICLPCECNNRSFGLKTTNNCDKNSGKCINCLPGYIGDHCEKCQAGYFHSNGICQKCDCNLNGTDYSGQICHPTTGKCICKNHVVNDLCNDCQDGYWGLEMNGHCSSCSCDVYNGSLSHYCNKLNGQCSCSSGFNGRICSSCMIGYYKSSNSCKMCDCNRMGTNSSICDQTTGKCLCIDKVDGTRCDRCTTNTAGLIPNCQTCHPCYDKLNNKFISIKNNLPNELSDANYDSFMKNITGSIEQLEMFIFSFNPNGGIFSQESVNKLLEELWFSHNDAISLFSQTHLQQKLISYMKNVSNHINGSSNYSLNNMRCIDKKQAAEIQFLILPFINYTDKDVMFVKEYLIGNNERNEDMFILEDLLKLLNNFCKEHICDYNNYKSNYCSMCLESIDNNIKKDILKIRSMISDPLMNHEKYAIQFKDIQLKYQSLDGNLRNQLEIINSLMADLSSNMKFNYTDVLRDLLGIQNRIQSIINTTDPLTDDFNTPVKFNENLFNIMVNKLQLINTQFKNILSKDKLQLQSFTSNLLDKITLLKSLEEKVNNDKSQLLSINFAQLTDSLNELNLVNKNINNLTQTLNSILQTKELWIADTNIKLNEQHNKLINMKTAINSLDFIYNAFNDNPVDFSNQSNSLRLKIQRLHEIITSRMQLYDTKWKKFMETLQITLKKLSENDQKLDKLLQLIKEKSTGIHDQFFYKKQIISTLLNDAKHSATYFKEISKFLIKCKNNDIFNLSDRDIGNDFGFIHQSNISPLKELKI